MLRFLSCRGKNYCRNSPLDEEVEFFGNPQISNKESKNVKGTPTAKYAAKSAVRTAVKKYEESLEEGDINRASELLKKVDSALDKAAQKGAIHRNQVSRRKSRLTRKLNVIADEAKSDEKGLA